MNYSLIRACDIANGPGVRALIDMRAFQQQIVREQINAEVLGDERLRKENRRNMAPMEN